MNLEFDENLITEEEIQNLINKKQKKRAAYLKKVEEDKNRPIGGKKMKFSSLKNGYLVMPLSAEKESDFNNYREYCKNNQTLMMEEGPSKISFSDDKLFWVKTFMDGLPVIGPIHRQKIEHRKARELRMDLAYYEAIKYIMKNMDAIHRGEFTPEERRKHVELEFKFKNSNYSLKITHGRRNTPCLSLKVLIENLHLHYGEDEVFVKRYIPMEDFNAIRETIDEIRKHLKTMRLLHPKEEEL